MIDIIITKTVSKEHIFTVNGKSASSLAGVSLCYALGKFLVDHKLFGQPINIHYQGGEHERV